MTKYIALSAGVIFLAVLVSFIIPEGKLNKSINFVVRIACIFILVSPVLQVFHITAGNETANLVDYDYLCAVYSRSQGDQIEKLVAENLGLDIDCTVEFTYEDGVFKENGVNIMTDFVDHDTIEKIQAYLHELGYININVNEKSD